MRVYDLPYRHDPKRQEPASVASQERHRMATVAEKTQLVDWEQVETRQTGTCWELRCPECKKWAQALLSTTAGSMCQECWKQRKDEGAPGAG